MGGLVSYDSAQNRFHVYRPFYLVDGSVTRSRAPGRDLDRTARFGESAIEGLTASSCSAGAQRVAPVLEPQLAHRGDWCGHRENPARSGSRPIARERYGSRARTGLVVLAPGQGHVG